MPRDFATIHCSHHSRDRLTRAIHARYGRTHGLVAFEVDRALEERADALESEAKTLKRQRANA